MSSVKEVEVGRECDTDGGEKKCIQSFDGEAQRKVTT
jgi:hypothetical protein